MISLNVLAIAASFLCCQQNDTIPAGATAILKSYPDFCVEYKDNKIIFKDGTSMVYDDNRAKSFDEKLDDSDIEDMFSIPYDMDGNPEYLADAGRSRCEALFKKMYGSSQAEAQRKLGKVNWFGQSLLFTTVNGADKQLKKVADELAKHPEYSKYMKSAGTFNWRPVRGAKRLSAHSYGIAIDIAVQLSDYWLWEFKGKKETDKIGYKNRIPMGIVEIFEKYGFVWGGRWYHFDTMHFEYRPEIINYFKK